MNGHFLPRQAALTLATGLIEAAMWLNRRTVLITAAELETFERGVRPGLPAVQECCR